MLMQNFGGAKNGIMGNFEIQGCTLRKITRNPKAANHEIRGAQSLQFYVKSKLYKVNFFCCLKKM